MDIFSRFVVCDYELNVQKRCRRLDYAQPHGIGAVLILIISMHIFLAALIRHTVFFYVVAYFLSEVFGNARIEVCKASPTVGRHCVKLFTPALDLVYEIRFCELVDSVHAVQRLHPSVLHIANVDDGVIIERYVHFIENEQHNKFIQQFLFGLFQYLSPFCFFGGKYYYTI